MAEHSVVIRQARKVIDSATDEDFDEFLVDLLVACWPTKVAQNS